MKVIATTDFIPFESELNNFWKQNCKHFGLTPSRHFEYLKWRFHDNPHNVYTLWLFYRGNELRGYSVTRKDRVRKWVFILKRLAIEDLVARGNNEDIYADIITYHRTHLGDCYGISIRALERFNWKESRGSNFLVYYNRPKTPNEEWHITEILTEGLNQDEDKMSKTISPTFMPSLIFWLFLVGVAIYCLYRVVRFFI